MVKVSIIVPVYNVEKYVERCLESLINQTYKNIEIIIVVDGATDNSLEICRKYEKRDYRIQIITKQNEGLGFARNTGLEYVTGKYVLFVDSDDYVESNLVEEVCKIAEKGNYDFIRFHNYREDLITGNKSVRKTPLSEGDYDKNKINSEILFPIIGVLPRQTGDHFVGMSVWRNLYKIDIIKKRKLKFVSEREFISEDVIFNLHYFYYSNRAYVKNIPYYHYIVNDDSLTAKYNPDRFIKEVAMYKEVLSIVDNFSLKFEGILRAQRTFLDRTRMCIKLEFNRKEKISVKIKAVKSILSNVELIQVLDEYPINEMTFSYRIILLLMRLKQSLALFFVYKVLGKI